MSLLEDLDGVLTVAEVPLNRLGVLVEPLPAEWIEAAAALSAQASIRRRRLPPDMVLWLVIGMAFFRGESIVEVARRLNICAKGLAGEELLAKSSLSQARERQGKLPIKWLFERCASAWGNERYPEDHWHGLQVFAADGALFRTQDTPELRAHFGSGNTATNRQTPYPMLRLVALMNTRSRLLVNATISPYRKGEIPMVAQFVAAIPDHSVTLLDKGFFSADLLLQCRSFKRSGMTVDGVTGFGHLDRPRP